MAYDPKVRASGEDRDRTAALLREHHALGRITAEEFSERLDKAFAATTIGDLEDLLSDLPGMDLYRLPAELTRQPRQAHAVVGPAGHMSPGWRTVWGVYLTVNLVCLVVYVLSGAGYPWVLWVAGPGVPLAVLAGSYWSIGADRSSRRHLGPGLDQGQLPGGPG
jgi:Domain of unknown function (DUF1707)